MPENVGMTLIGQQTEAGLSSGRNLNFLEKIVNRNVNVKDLGSEGL
jgi:hypothetical protein